MGYKKRIIMESTYEAYKSIYSELRNINTRQEFLAILGVLIDQWFVDHDMSVAQAHEMLVELTRAHDYVNRLIGEAQKSVETNDSTLGEEWRQ